MEQMKNERIEKLQESWELDTRWKGITRPYSAEDVKSFGHRFIQKITLTHLGH